MFSNFRQPDSANARIVANVDQTGVELIEDAIKKGVALQKLDLRFLFRSFKRVIVRRNGARLIRVHEVLVETENFERGANAITAVKGMPTKIPRMQFRRAQTGKACLCGEGAPLRTTFRRPESEPSARS
jgi:hypothetical protein